MFRLLFVDEWFLDSEPKETGRAFCALRHEDDVRWEHYHIKRLYKMMIMNKVFPSLEPHQFHNWKLNFSSTKASEPKRLITLKTVKWGNWNHNHHVLVEYQSQRKFQDQVFITLTNTKWSMSQYASRSNVLPEQSSRWFSTIRVLFTAQVGSITTLEGIFRTISCRLDNFDLIREKCCGKYFTQAGYCLWEKVHSWVFFFWVILFWLRDNHGENLWTGFLQHTPAIDKKHVTSCK